jgi:PAS domain S-box-containing protein
MSFLSPILQTLPYLTAPTLFGWVVWVLLLGVTGYSLYTWRRYHLTWRGSQWGLFFGLLVLSPFAVLLVGFHITSSTALPTPGIPTAQFGSALLPFAGLPWTLAAGLLGPVGAVLVGGLSGLLRGLWDTHSLFTMLEIALLGAVYSAAIRQQYRTVWFRILRQPLFAVILLIPLQLVLYVLGAYFAISGETTVRLDYALSNVGAVTLAFTGEMLVAGLVAQIVSVAFPKSWGGQREVQPSPTERSLEARFVFGTGIFILLLLITLLIGDWIVAGNAARRMLRDRLSSTAQMASQTVPFFLETGQNLAEQIASNPRLLDTSEPGLSTSLGEQLQAVPYFNQAFVLDAATRTVLGCYPASACQSFALFPEEDAGVSFALNNVPSQIYSIPPGEPGGVGRISFVVAIKDGAGQTQRILLGRTDLGLNPLTQPLIQSLSAMADLGGTGILLDDNGTILYHPDATRIRTTYTGQRSDQSLFYDDTAPDGTRQMVYYQPVTGRAWAIVLTVPAQRAQQLALEIALPLSAMLVILALFALISLRFGLRAVTRSLRKLAREADRIAQGQLDRPLQVEGEDEVGQLGRAFEKMRLSLRDRLEELNRLLVVSQDVSSTLDMGEAFKPVLDAALVGGASAARVALSPQLLPETPMDSPSRFSAGESRDTYAYLDDKILNLAEKQERVIWGNVARERNLDLDGKAPHPASLMAVALRHKKRYYGVLWVAYDQPHAFSEGDIRFISTLAGQASLAAANTHLFLNVEVSRRQLEAILNSSPDPVLVTDPRNRLLLANAAAEQALGTKLGKSEGQPTQRLIQQKPLLNLLNAAGEKQSVEVLLPDGRTYLATASSVLADGHQVGRVCILRDVTHFKELDTLKSEFVSTVSHDLRSPLTLIRGYATMLDMVGELNEQQHSYVGKIITGVENMARLVNDLLDLGRIELGVDLQVEPVSVLDVLEKVTGTLQIQASQKEIDLSLELPKDLPDQISADPALFHQAIYNLVENAIKYTSEGGQVFVRVHNQVDNLVFEIQDTGIGIAPEDMTRLFEKFYRGKAREARTRAGTGLGLAIVRSIAERHGGRVWVESEEGKGSTFYLQIPIERPKESQAI